MLDRVDKVLALQLNISRSAVKQLSKSGSITLNGEVIKKPEVKVDLKRDIICVNGEKLNVNQNLYIMMNKPKGVICASNDKTKTTVIDVLPPEQKRRGLFSVGRLDKNTIGLLIITDDGDFSHRVISPKSGINKRYIVKVDGIITEQMITIFKNGITLSDGTKCLPATLNILSENTAEVVIGEGKYHQIKRMFGTVGLGVNELKRIKIGGLALDESLAEGESRFLTDNELLSIFDKNA